MPLLPLFPGVGGSDGMPDRRVEIAFATGPSDSPIWTDVTADVRVINTRRGRSRNLDRYQAGHMSVTLDNRARAYDPTTVATVLPMKRIRFIADGQTQFDGYVDSWDLGYEKPNEAVVVVRASDGFKRLQRVTLPTSPFATEVLADGPTSWWRVGEPSGASIAFDAIGSKHADYLGSPTQGVASLVNKEAGTSVTFSHATGQSAQYEDRAISAYPFTIEAWFRAASDPGSERVIFSEDWEADQIPRVALSASVFGVAGVPEDRVVFEIQNDGSATDNLVYSSVDTSDNQIHHVMAVASSATDLKLYIDGVDRTTVSVLNGASIPATGGFAGALGNATKTSVVPGSFGLGGELQDVVVYNGVALSAARALAHYRAGASGALKAWRDDLPGARANRILDHAGWRAADRDLDTGESTLQAASIAGQTALEHLQKVAESEFGDLFMSRDGKVRLVARANLINLDNAATFGDSGSDLRYAEIAFDYSDEQIRNEVTISRNDGVARTAEDDASVLAFGRISYTRDGLIHDSDVLSGDAVDFFLSEYANPLLRVTEITILPQRDPGAIFPAILPRDLGDYVTVKRTPPGGGAQIVQESRIEGISHTVTPKFWETKWQLSDAYAGTDFFELDDGAGSAPLGLGSSTSDGPSLYF